MDIIPFPLHIFTHFALAILVGYLAGRHFKQIKLGILIGFLGGFLIDLDHLLEYLLFFGPHFNLGYFLDGRQFLLSNQIHLWFHAWEYIPLLILAAIILKKHKILETILVTLALAMSVHLLTDSIINQYSLQYYSLAYRADNNFAVEKLLSPEEYLKHLEQRRELGLE